MRWFLRCSNIITFSLFAVCLSELKDTRNAMAAFEKAANMPDVEKYPLACLNHAIFSYQCHEYGPSWKSLNRYLAIMESKKGGTDQQTGGSMRNVRLLLIQLEAVGNAGVFKFNILLWRLGLSSVSGTLVHIIDPLSDVFFVAALESGEKVNVLIKINLKRAGDGARLPGTGQGLFKWSTRRSRGS